ncbi:MAG: hypothetical protein ABIQ57_18325 [Candidatus Kapaibacterium sp.]
MEKIPKPKPHIGVNIAVWLVADAAGIGLAYAGSCSKASFPLLVAGMFLIAVGLESLIRIWLTPWRWCGIAVVLGLIICGRTTAFREQRELAENGKTIMGIVADTTLGSPTKTPDGRFIRCVYTINGIAFSKTQETDAHTIGDSIPMRYAVACPEISEIVGR